MEEENISQEATPETAVPEVPVPEVQQEEIFTCDICKTYTGPRMKVRGHRIRCKGAPTPERERPTPDRKERIPIGVPRQTDVPYDDKEYHYHIFNDDWSTKPDRIKRAEDAGYAVVREVGRRGTNADGSAIKGILMKLPQELYQEDQKIKMKEVDKVDQAIKKGTIEERPGDKRYIPQGIKIWSNQNEKG
jgi:hypothetical protein